VAETGAIMKYSQLLQDHPHKLPVLNEKVQNYHFITERHLQAMWLEQKYFKNLATDEGEPIEVISPGIWNSEAGPDFMKAHLRIDGRELRGDIELHLHDEGWQLHGHHTDVRYNRVILHLSLWTPKNGKPLQTQAGTFLTKAYFEERLTIPLSRILSLIDLDLYPYKKFVGSGRCAGSLFQTLPEQKIESLFQSAAGHRLLEKADQLIAQAGEAPPFLVGLARALGYKHNGDAFQTLFCWLYRHYRHVSPRELFAMALDMGDFFGQHYQKKWGASTYYQELSALSKTLSRHPEYRLNLVLHHVRPYNHPVRRMALLSKMLADSSAEELYSRMSAHWYASAASCRTPSDWRLLKRELLALFPTYEDAHWSSHFTFEEKASEETLTLLGDTVRQEMLVNVFLPLLYKEIEQLSEEQLAPMRRAFLLFYYSIGFSPNSKTKYLTHRFFGNTTKGNIVKTAPIQQGMLQLHRDFCVHHEASCNGCPFVDRYKALQG
jgi:hypothetical protein